MESTTIVHPTGSLPLEKVSLLFRQVYNWMALGLLVTGLTAFAVASSPSLLDLVFSTRFVFTGLLILEVVLVISITAVAKRQSAGVLATLFLLYSFVSGITFSVIFLVYTAASIFATFLIAASMFGVMALYGYTTKKDLTSWGTFLLMALVGLIIASLVGIFFQNDAFATGISLIGVVIFVGLTAYDNQKIKQMALTASDEATMRKVAVLGALTLYLDLVNLILSLLRIFGKRK